MDTLQITTGEKKIPIVRNGANVGEIVFNPSDVLFAEKFYRLAGEFQEKFAEYQEQAKELDANKEKDANDIPVNMPERLQLLETVCDFIKVKIDSLFGIGTSAMVFGDAVELEMFTQFFSGMTPFVQKARGDKLKQYMSNVNQRNLQRINPKVAKVVNKRNGKHPR